jgi:hypothetical protein
MIGATVHRLIQNTLESQKRQQYTDTARLPIIIDEFQRVAGAEYRTLSELHKYGATFFLGTQSFEYLQKINPLLWPTLQANVRQLVAFNMSAQDASLISKELGVDQEDILHLDISTCYVSVLAAGRRQPTFSLKLNPPSTFNPVQAESIRTRCRIRYTRPVAEVDEQLSDAMLRSIRMVPQPDDHSSQLPDLHSDELEDLEHLKDDATSQNLLEQLESWEGLSDEQREELDLMEIEAYNAAEEEEANEILDGLEAADKPQSRLHKKNLSL